MFLVEFWNLKPECIQVGKFRAPFLGFFFCLEHKLISITTASIVFPDPHQVNVEPVPISCANDSPDNIPLSGLEDETQVLTVIPTFLLRIVITDTAPDDIPCGLIHEYDL